VKQGIDALNEFSKQLKSGSIYLEIETKLKELQKSKSESKKKIKTIEGLREQILKKENQIEKLYADIIHLQNKLSEILDAELNKLH
jgi:organic radical activating enzyme